MRAYIASVGAGLLLTGCVVTPRLDLDGVAISEVVQRIKCELAFAVRKIDIAGTYDPSKPFHWMKYWTAKVDLELETTETGAVTASNSFILPTFTFGLGGSLKTEAYRSNVLSFTLSMDELADFNSLNECDSPNRLGLLGNLGLEEWITSALVPVRKRQLTVGYHRPPTGKPTQIFGPGEAGPPSKAALVPGFEATISAIKAAEDHTENARVAAVQAKEFARRNNIKDTYFRAKEALDTTAKAEVALKEAEVRFWEAKRVKFPMTESDDMKNAKAVAERIKDVAEQIKSVKQAATAAWELLPRDAPLDSITHSVKFTVTASANATPNWILAHFRGPGLSAPFANAQRQRIHDLTVVLGSPAEPGGKALSDEQQRQLLYQKLDALRRQGVVVLPLN